MPALPYPRYENFALLLAEGQTEAEAARLSGFVGALALEGIKSGQYWPLVQARVVELRSEMQIEAPAPPVIVDPDMDPDEVTPQRLQREMWSVYAQARNDGNLKPALTALELMGKAKGMFVQHKDITIRSIGQMSDEQIKALLIDLPETEFEELPAPDGFKATDE